MAQNVQSPARTQGPRKPCSPRSGDLPGLPVRPIGQRFLYRLSRRRRAGTPRYSPIGAGVVRQVCLSGNPGGAKVPCARIDEGNAGHASLRSNQISIRNTTRTNAALGRHRDFFGSAAHFGVEYGLVSPIWVTASCSILCAPAWRRSANSMLLCASNRWVRIASRAL